jgi:hypothetical protein
MTSKISTSQFSERLEYRTRYGNPVYWGPIAFLNLFFNQTTETFYGDFGPGWFELSNNNFNRVPFVIAGNYTKNNDETTVTYEIRTNYYGFFCIHTITFLVIAMNIHFIFAVESPQIIVNIIIVLIFLLRYFAIYHKKRGLEKDFLEIFEITKESLKHSA